MGLQLLEHGGFAQYLTGLLRASVEKNGNFLLRSLIGTDQGCTGTSEIKKASCCLSDVSLSLADTGGPAGNFEVVP